MRVVWILRDRRIDLTRIERTESIKFIDGAIVWESGERAGANVGFSIDILASMPAVRGKPKPGVRINGFSLLERLGLFQDRLNVTASLRG